MSMNGGREGIRRRVALKLGAILGSGIISGATFGTTSAATATQSRTEAILENDLVRLTIDRETGGVRQLRAKADGSTLCSDDVPEPPRLWAIDFYHSEYDRVLTASTFDGPSNIDYFNLDDGGAGLKLVFDQPRIKSSSEGAFDRSFAGTVTVEARLSPDDPLIRWRAEVENEDELAVRKITVPELRNIKALAPGTEDALVLPREMGRRIPNPTERVTFSTRSRYPTSSGTMQFTAYTHPGVGFYADATDTSGHAKNIRWGNQSDDINLLEFGYEHQFPNQPGADITIPYTTRLGVLDGDWYDAADRYRSFLERDGWLPTTPPEHPPWLDRTGAAYTLESYERPSVKTSGDALSFTDIVDFATSLRERLGTRIQVRWNGWSKNGSPAGGDWLPPAEGWDAFRSSVDQLSEADIGVTGFFGPYVGLKSADWWQENTEPAHNYAVRDPDGTIHTNYDAGTGLDWVLIEITQDGWYQRYQSVLEQLVENGVDQIHLDGFPKQVRLDCYSDVHAHPPGDGGVWHTQAARSDLQTTASRLRKIRQDIVIEGEGSSDFFLPYLQLHITPDVRGVLTQPMIQLGAAEVIPLFEYTFSDYVKSQSKMGWPLAEAYDQDLLRLHLGRMVDWGIFVAFSLPVSLSNDVVDDVLITYLGRLARLRARYGRQFLAQGQMLRAPRLDTDSITVESTPGTETADAVLSSAWRSANDETVGIALTNVAPDGNDRTVELNFAHQPFDIADAPELIFTVHNGHFEVRATDGTTESIEVTIEQDDVVLVSAGPTTATKREALENIVAAQAETEDLKTPKQLFGAGKYAEARDQAATILSESEAATTSTDQPEETNQTKERTSSDGSPGFGLLSTVAGVSIGAKLLRRIVGDNDGDND